MKIGKTGNIQVWYKADRLDGYTILMPNGDLWGTAPDPDILCGYAGNITDAGYTSEEYQQWAKDNPKKVGRIVYSHEELPSSVIEYIQQIVNSEEE